MQQRNRCISLNKNYELEITFPYDPGLVDAVRETFERPNYQKHRRLWLAPPTAHNLKIARNFTNLYGFQVNISADAGDASDFMERYRHHRIADSLSMDADIKVAGLGGTLYPFQRAGVEYAARMRRCIIADEMGTGKTIEALATLQYVNAFPALVICPASLKLHWHRESLHWLPTRSVIILNGQTSALPPADILIVNYDVLLKYIYLLEKQRFKALVCDEAHYLKNSQTQRTRAVQLIAKDIPYRLLLTGTPVLNCPQELLSPLCILGKIWDFGGTQRFLRRYCPPRRGAHSSDHDGAAHLDELHQSLRVNCYLRRTKHQVLPELPPKQQARIWVELDEYQSYRELEHATVAWVQKDEGRKSIPIHNILQRLSLLRRKAACHKLPAVQAWVHDFLASGEKLVLFAYHQEVVQALSEAFQAPAITGKMSVKQRRALVEQFQNDLEMQLLVLSLRVGSIGWTLHAARNVAFVEMDWTPGAHDQAEDRLHRIGQRSAVTAWYLLARDTIDEDIYALVERKRHVVDTVTEGGSAMSILRHIIERQKM